jgi:hypothetical protein
VAIWSSLALAVLAIPMSILASTSQTGCCWRNGSWVRQWRASS